MNISTFVESVQTLAIMTSGWELLIVGGVALLLFGSRLPGAAKSLGMSFSAFKKGIKEGEEETSEPPNVEPPASAD